MLVETIWFDWVGNLDVIISVISSRFIQYFFPFSEFKLNLLLQWFCTISFVVRIGLWPFVLFFIHNWEKKIEFNQN